MMISLHRFLTSYSTRNDILRINNSSKTETTPPKAQDPDSRNRKIDFSNSSALEIGLKECQDPQLKELRFEMLTMIKSLKSEMEQKFVINSEIYTKDLE